MIRIAEGGMPWVLAGFAITFLVLGASFFTNDVVSIILMVLSVLFFMLSCLLIVFFRDPDRQIGQGIVAVADGKIREIKYLQDPDMGECVRISTFLNIQNVHVNRMPYTGKIEKMTHHPGGHVPAFQKDSEGNERVVLLIRTEMGIMKVVQIAGTVARRIVPYVVEGTVVKKGEKIGLIRLGSRVDLYLPAKNIKSLTIQVHGRVKAGEDTVAEIHD
jgi:phosphatidylserine decarboxylase